LAPALGTSYVAGGQTFISAHYPEASWPNPAPAGSEAQWTSGDVFSPPTGHVVAGVLVESANLTGEARIVAYAGDSAIGRLTLDTDTPQAMLWFSEPASADFKLVCETACGGELRTEIAELQETKPNFWDAALIQRLGSAGNGRQVEGRGVDITTKIDVNDRTGDSRVIYTVNEGGKQIVRRIDFVGNDSVLSKDLRKAMKTKTKNLLSVINKSGRLVPSQLQEDRDAIRFTYQNRGFADAQVTDVQIVPLDDQSVELVFTINEGRQYSVNQLRLDGVNVTSPDELKARLTMSDGSLYTPDGLGADIKTLQEFYGTQGYIDSSIIPEISPAGAGMVNVTYRINEGAQ
jgi:hypothetical protein